MGLALVDVGGGAVGAEDVDGVDDGLGEVAVEVVAGADEAIGADELAGGLDPVGFGVVHAVDEDGAVHGDVERVEGEFGFEAGEEFGFEGVVDGAGDGAAGDGAGVERWEEPGFVAAEFGEFGVVGDVGAAKDAEVGVLHADGVIGAAFGVEAADGDAGDHGFSGGRALDMPQVSEPNCGGRGKGRAG